LLVAMAVMETTWSIESIRLKQNSINGIGSKVREWGGSRRRSVMVRAEGANGRGSSLEVIREGQKFHLASFCSHILLTKVMALAERCRRGPNCQTNPDLRGYFAKAAKDQAPCSCFHYIH
jgi:hypothetical protein